MSPVGWGRCVCVCVCVCAKGCILGGETKGAVADTRAQAARVGV